MNWITVLGIAAATLTTVSFLPQAVKTIKTRDTGGISIFMYAVLISGIVLWLIYGILNKDLPIILANVFTFLFTGSILILALKFKASPRPGHKRQ